MTTIKRYIFTSDRLGFRNWMKEDIAILSELNADKEVMKYFPATQTKEQTVLFIERMQQEFEEKSYCYFAVETLHNLELIGFIGIHEQTFEADFTPCVDIGWRLKRSAWKQGFASEGAKRVLQYAFNELKLDAIYSIAPEINLPSENVMKKIGMKKLRTFDFSLLKDNRLKSCVLYQITKEMYDQQTS